MISNRQYWLFMAVAALLIAALASYAIPQSSFALTAETATKLAGGAGTLLILPAILVVPWRQVQLTKRSVTNTPLYAGTALFAMMAFVALVGATLSGS